MTKDVKRATSEEVFSVVAGTPYKRCDDGSYECAVCGSFILDRQKHGAYHQRQRKEADARP